MKRFIAVWFVCAAASIGSFSVLLAEDRHLGVPLPYSVPIAFASMQIVGAALLGIAESLRAKRPIVVRVVERRRKTTRMGRPVGAHAEGSVLLDLSTLAPQGHAI